MSEMPKLVALVPARSGSQRVKAKNVRPLGEHPLIAYTLAVAEASGIFADIVVSTDSEEYAAIARHYGGEVPFLRPAEFASSTSPDIEWVRHALQSLAAENRHYDAFSILRPTSPFRSVDMLRRAWTLSRAAEGIDSLRAVELCAQHPGKMWVVKGERMVPLLPLGGDATPWHSSQYQSLPEVYVQNASLEIAWTRVVEESGTIAGDALMPFHADGCEGFDINTEQDWWFAERLLAAGEAQLPVVNEH